MEVSPTQDFRQVLKEELARRTQKNPAYSLRAFAKALGTSAQNLSFVLNSKRGLSLELAAQFAERLGLDPVSAGVFFDLVSSSCAKSPHMRTLAKTRLEESQRNRNFHALGLDQFRIIADPMHYTIMELTETRDFKNDIKWIAQRIQRNPLEVKHAIERLMRYELLEEKKGSLRKTHLNVSIGAGQPGTALKNFTRTLLERATESLDSQSTEERDITTMTMAIDPALLPEAKKMLRDFRRKLTHFLEQGNRTEVYALVPALFKLTRRKQ